MQYNQVNIRLDLEGMYLLNMHHNRVCVLRP